MTLTEFLLARVAEDEADAESVYLWGGSGSDDFSGLADRVLAECEAKRRIIAEHPDYGGYGQSCARCPAGDVDLEPWPCPTIRALGLPYADHPECREEWKP